MSSAPISRFVAFGELAIAGAALAFSFFLLASPLFPRVADSHGGWLGFFSGLAVLPFVLAGFIAGLSLKSGKSWRAWSQLVFAAVATFYAFVILH